MVENTVGRPTKYKKEYCEMIVEYMSGGASITSFAASIDVARSTITDWTAIHPEFRAAVKKGKAKCAAWWEKLGREGAQGSDVNPTLVIFGLKNMAADDWSDRREIDHKSSDGSMAPKTIKIEVVKSGSGDKTS